VTADLAAEPRADPRRNTGRGRSRWRLFDLDERERARALALSALFFLIVAVFWVVKPVKRGLLLSHHDVSVVWWGWTLEAAQLEQLAKGLNMVAALVAVAVFTRLVRVLSRRRLLLVLCSACAIAFAAFGVLVSSPGPVVVWSLYVFGDVYATLMIGAFWALTNDLTTKGEAERSYGLIGLGGVVGGFVGATVVRGWVEATGRGSLLFGCAVVLVVIALLAVRVDAMAKPGSPGRGGPLAAHDGTSAWLEGAKLALRSRYLLALMALVSSYEIVSSVVDFQLAATVATAVEGSTEKDAFFGMVGQIVGVASIVVQLVLTSWIMRRLGIGVALLVLPVAVLGGSVGFFVMPSLVLAAIMSTSDNALSYSVNQSAREALYVPLTRDEKYKAKAFIDMFVQRAAKVGAVVVNLAVAERLGLGRVRWLSLAVIVLVAAWIALARWMASRHAELVSEPAARERERSSAEVAAPGGEEDGFELGDRAGLGIGGE
jgi:ATP:ADP antiporter, AAA family